MRRFAYLMFISLVVPAVDIVTLSTAARAGQVFRGQEAYEDCLVRRGTEIAIERGISVDDAVSLSVKECKDKPLRSDGLTFRIKIKIQEELTLKKLNDNIISKHIPKIDVDSICERFGRRREINECIERNQLAYNFINAIWPSISDDIYVKCLVASNNNNSQFAAYDIWADCISNWTEFERQQKAGTMKNKFVP